MNLRVVSLQAPAELIMLQSGVQRGFDSKCDNGTLWTPKTVSQ